MPGFRFSLQRLLELRGRAENSARCQLEHSQYEEQQHRTRLQQLELACSEAAVGAAASPGEPVEPGVLLNANLYKARLTVLAAAQQERVTTLSAREQRDREQLLDTARDRQVVERLKERRYEQFLTERTRAESRSTEEAARLAFLNRRSA